MTETVFKFKFNFNYSTWTWSWSRATARSIKFNSYTCSWNPHTQT